MTVDRLTDFCAEYGDDRATGEARSSYAAEIARRGGAVPWSPGRNEPLLVRLGSQVQDLSGVDPHGAGVSPAAGPRCLSIPRKCPRHAVKPLSSRPSAAVAGGGAERSLLTFLAVCMAGFRGSFYAVRSHPVGMLLTCPSLLMNSGMWPSDDRAIGGEMEVDPSLELAAGQAGSCQRPCPCRLRPGEPCPLASAWWRAF
jgi:hypothetical protein